MKTIVITHNYSEVSFAAMSYHLANYLAELGHQVVFISHHPYFPEKKIIAKGVGEIVVCSWPTTKRPTSLKDFLWYCKIHLKYKPDVIIGHFVGSNITILGSKVLSLGKTKTFDYYHTLTDQLLTDLKKVTLKQRLLFFRKKVFYSLFCDVVICPSELAKKDLALFHGIRKGTVVLNPMVDRFENKKNFPKNIIIISYLGRLDASKGVIDLIEAYKEYKMKVTNSKVILRIAGTGSQAAKIKELVDNSLGIEYFGGLTYNCIDDYLNESHFTVIPSKFDNLPTVGLESIMNQTPLLISNTTGLADYLTDGKECFKFDSNIASMVALFGRVESNFDLQEQMSRNARITYLDKFSMKMYCDTFSKFLL
ncbi:glycosyltransferase family 4 protein [Flavobacterium sp. I-STPA6A]|uniref:glycosyltransferase family 4 protein n=1 Tax=Flavobacterium sp. I-STPA6A TaxID=2590450 RepID=UPI00131B00C5|nr:glycosyltransferase family 4 protein [Flavobacterium sp. I-STPA6A]